MTHAERLLTAIVDLQSYLIHDIDKSKCGACPRFEELQSAALGVVSAYESERIRRVRCEKNLSVLEKQP